MTFLYMNKLLIGLGFVAILVVIYYYTQSDIKEPMKTQNKSFIASKKFKGEKKGYYFRMDTKGLGYYLDKKKK